MERDQPPPDEQAYFLAIERHFIRLRGAPLLLSPADWQTAAGWRRAGIPLELVCRTLDELFARRAERGARRPVGSLSYCRRAVEAAWERERDLRSALPEGGAAPLDVESALARLADSLPDGLPGVDEVAGKIRALAGPPERVEAALAALDDELLERAAEKLDPAARRAVDERVERALDRLGERLAAKEREEARRRLRRNELRRALTLPVLSLFG